MIRHLLQLMGRGGAVGTGDVRPVAILLQRERRGDRLEQDDYTRAQAALGRTPRLTSALMAARLAEELELWEDSGDYFNPDGQVLERVKKAEAFAMRMPTVAGHVGAAEQVLRGTPGSWSSDLERHRRGEAAFPEPHTSFDYREAAKQLRSELGDGFLEGDETRRAAMVRDWMRNYRRRGDLPPARRPG